MKEGRQQGAIERFVEDEMKRSRQESQQSALNGAAVSPNSAWRAVDLPGDCNNTANITTSMPLGRVLDLTSPEMATSQGLHWWGRP